MQRSIESMATTDRVLLSGDLHRLSAKLQPLSEALSRIAPEFYPYYAPFGTELSHFVDRLNETSRELLSDHPWAPLNVCRCLAADIGRAP